MKIINMIKVITLCGLRDFKTMLMMCLLPIILILILGSALGSMMGDDESYEISDIEFEYVTYDETSVVSNSFEKMIDEFDGQDLNGVKSYDIEKSKQKVRDGKITSVVYIKDDEITLFKSANESIEGTVLEVILSSYCSTYNTFATIAEIKPEALSDYSLENYQNGFVAVEGVSKKRRPTAMEYYGILMTVLFCLYGLMEPVFSKIERKNSGVIKRASIAPVKPMTQFVGEILGYYVINIIRLSIVFICTIVLFDVYWGETPIYPLLMLLSLNLMMVSGGVLLGDIFNRQEAASGIVQIFIIASAFLGGAYVPLDTIGRIGEVGKYVSAIWWGNTGIINHIFSGDNANMITGISAYLLISIVFLMVGVIKTKIKEAN